jgi:hypothetical protein
MIPQSKRWIVALSATLLLVMIPSPAHSVSTAELVGRSRAAAVAGDWNASARALEELVAAGIDETDVRYDLGTAYANAGRYGEAIWCFEWVIRREWLRSDAQHNLRASRLRLAHRDAERTGRAVAEQSLPWRETLGELVPADAAVAAALVSQLLLFAAVWVFRKRRTEALRIAAVCVIVVASSATVLSWSILAARSQSSAAAIVKRDGVRLLAEPSEDAIAGEAVREGERVSLVEKTATFVRARTLSGLQGWLRMRDIGEL